MNAEATQDALREDIRFARSVGGNSFPSLFLQHNGAIQPIPHHYTDAAEVLRSIGAGLAE